MRIWINPSEAAGWIGMVLIHSATLPTTIKAALGYEVTMPPISMVLLVWAGLFLFLLRAIGINDRLGVASNAIGFLANTLLLALIVFK
jgi:hypothetical protein